MPDKVQAIHLLQPKQQPDLHNYDILYLHNYTSAVQLLFLQSHILQLPPFLGKPNTRRSFADSHFRNLQK